MAGFSGSFQSLGRLDKSPLHTVQPAFMPAPFYRLLRLLPIMAAAWVCTAPAAAFESLAAPEVRASTRLFDVTVRSELSQKVRAFRDQPYELSAGALAPLEDWYRPRTLPDTVFRFLTPFGPDNGLVWGFGTGERGRKYRIDPSIHLGWAHQTWLSPRTRMGLQISAQLGGRLRERSCTADYGDIGGVTAVNCRLAATEMPPEQTLALLANTGPERRIRVHLSFSHSF